MSNQTFTHQFCLIAACQQSSAVFHLAPIGSCRVRHACKYCHDITLLLLLLSLTPLYSRPTNRSTDRPTDQPLYHKKPIQQELNFYLTVCSGHLNHFKYSSGFIWCDWISHWNECEFISELPIPNSIYLSYQASNLQTGRPTGLWLRLRLRSRL